jgi:hypothetical protein
VSRPPRTITVSIDELERVVRRAVASALQSGRSSPAAWDDRGSDESERTDPTSTPAETTGTASSPVTARAKASARVDDEIGRYSGDWLFEISDLATPNAAPTFRSPA